jgi:hypothetical protein
MDEVATMRPGPTSSKVAYRKLATCVARVPAPSFGAPSCVTAIVRQGISPNVSFERSDGGRGNPQPLSDLCHTDLCDLLASQDPVDDKRETRTTAARSQSRDVAGHPIQFTKRTLPFKGYRLS